jgi:aconitase A
VGGIEAEAVMLGRAIRMRVPEVIGVRLRGVLRSGVFATDLALALTERLRAEGVVAAILEFCGAGVDTLSVPDRATVSNMSPEYGATASLFPIDARTIEYLALSGRTAEQSTARNSTMSKAPMRRSNPVRRCAYASTARPAIQMKSL